MGEDIQSTMNYTTLVGVKWTPESMLKIHEKMWDSYLKKMVNHYKYRKSEKIKRIEDIHTWMNLIHDRILEKDIKFKKN